MGINDKEITVYFTNPIAGASGTSGTSGTSVIGGGGLPGVEIDCGTFADDIADIDAGGFV